MDLPDETILGVVFCGIRDHAGIRKTFENPKWRSVHSRTVKFSKEQSRIVSCPALISLANLFKHLQVLASGLQLAFSS
jgi:hypothetical protein